MNQDRFKNYTELLGVAAIVASLAFVAFEIRQNTDAVRSTIIQTVSQQSFDGVALGINNEYLREAQDAELTGSLLTQEQSRALDRMYNALMRIQMNRYMQSKIGVIDQDLILEIGGRAGIYSRNSFKDYWTRNRDEYSEGFQDFVEQVLIDTGEN